MKIERRFPFSQWSLLWWLRKRANSQSKWRDLLNNQMKQPKKTTLWRSSSIRLNMTWIDNVFSLIPWQPKLKSSRQRSKTLTLNEWLSLKKRKSYLGNTRNLRASFPNLSWWKNRTTRISTSARWGSSKAKKASLTISTRTLTFW